MKRLIQFQNQMFHNSSSIQIKSQPLDLRSDTLSKPTPNMLKKCISANVGDDSYGEDQTAIKLQKKMAHIFQKPAALYLPTTTMANTISLKYAFEKNKSPYLYYSNRSHVFLTEKTGLEWVMPQLQWIPVFDSLEKIDKDKIYKIIEINQGKGIICFENPTFDGQVLSKSYLQDIIAMKNRFPDIHIHLDGARIFEAINYYYQLQNREGGWMLDFEGSVFEFIGDDFKNVFEKIDTISVCFSKGLGCAMGSVIIGSEDFISNSFKFRKQLGGATRQAGYMAGMGLQCLEEIAPFLYRTHQLSQLTFDRLKDIENITILAKPQINMVFLKINSMKADELVKKMKQEYNILVKPYKNNEYIRIVYHYANSEDEVKYLSDALIQISNDLKK